jgi:hypothetical protein
MIIIIRFEVSAPSSRLSATTFGTSVHSQRKQQHGDFELNIMEYPTAMILFDEEKHPHKSI